ncbi:MAG: thioesterase family protein [Nitrospirota bacterium]
MTRHRPAPPKKGQILSELSVPVHEESPEKTDPPTQNPNHEKEKRQSARVQKRLPVQFTTSHPELKDRFHTAVSRDIGKEGVFLDVEHHETDLTHFLNHKKYSIDIEIHLPDGKVVIKAATEVVSVFTPENNRSGKHFGMGLKFIDLPSHKKTELEAYLRELEKSDSEVIDIQEHLSPKEQFTFTKTLYLSDTNALGNAYFARYFDWQGMAREEFLKMLLPDPIQAFKSGMRLLTVEAHMKYKQETTLYDEIEIEVHTAHLRKVSVDLIFIYRNKKTGKQVGEGQQRIAVSDARGKLVPFPPIMRHNILKYQIHPPRRSKYLSSQTKLEGIKE